MLPYEGIRIVDASRHLAGALAAMHLADFGADVVRWEPLAAGAPRDERAVGALVANRNKRLLRDSTGEGDSTSGGDGTGGGDGRPSLSQLRALARKADVVVTDRPRHELERLRIDSTSLTRANRRLVYLWTPPFGTAGALSTNDEDGLLLAAAGGVADYHSATHERPVAPVVPFLLYEQGMLAAAAAAAALLGRERSPSADPAPVTVSGLHAVAAMNIPIMVDAPGIVRLVGAKTGSQGAVNFRRYQCSDGAWIFLASLTPPFFFRALDVLDAWDLMLLPGVDGEFGNLRKPEVVQAVNERLERVFATRPLADWRRALDESDVPNAPVEDRRAWTESSILAANDGTVVLEHADLGPVRVPNVPVQLTATPGVVRHLPDHHAQVEVRDVWSDVPDNDPRELGPVAAAGPAHPLAGVRVLDFGTFIAGALGPSFLCDFGADVVKVESPGGDPYRLFSAAYAALNRGKSLSTLDLKDPASDGELHALVRSADVLVDNVRPGAQDRLGTSFEQLRRINPQLVKCSVSAWGAAPLTAPAFDPLIQARSGLMAAQGGAGDPVTQVMPVHDIACGTAAALGVLAALFARGRLGRGQEVRTSLTQASLTIQFVELTAYAGRPAPPLGAPDHDGTDALHRLYRCDDGWVALAADPERWTAPAVAALLTGERSGERAGSVPLADAVRDRSVEDVLDVLAASGIAAAPVLSRNRIFEDPWLTENRFFRMVDDPRLGRLVAVRGFADWGSTPDDRVMKVPASPNDHVDVTP